jgi:S1-C subfamily serine protease
MRPDNRYVPLAQIEFESPTEPTGMTPIIDMNGRLVGLLSASISPAAESLPAIAGNNVGPVGVTVGYGLYAGSLGRVIEGFLTDDHKVENPTIGISFKSSTDMTGAVITQIHPDSAAAAAGLTEGMVIFQADNTPIRKSVDLASFLFQTEVGQTVDLYMKDLDKTIVRKVKIRGVVTP